MELKLAVELKDTGIEELYKAYQAAKYDLHEALRNERLRVITVTDELNENQKSSV